ncbi:butyrophilin-like protein 2 isoform X2 [Petaurus breviceps papuanus]|uniref:butyrophilin-like protein 2 isoform X2 n=1 Tax=Petaurus breviceps papuanus TaxID=3040969 RepID=UPI0036DDD37D
MDATSWTVLSVTVSIASFLGILLMRPSDQFTVIGPAEPILVKLSEDILLPCHLSPKMSAEYMEVSWFRSHFSDAVYVYRDGKTQDEEQAVEYRGRTELVKDTIAEGNVTLRIQSVRLSDNGQYWCRFQENHEYGEANSEVIVTSLGTAPHIRMEGPVDKRIQLVCISRGWFPEPQAKWRYVGGDEPLPSKIQILVIDGLFHVEMSLVITEDSSVRNVSCSIYNPVLDEEKVSFIYIPEKLDEELALRKVIGPTQSIITSLGEDVLLPCHLFPEMNAQHMEVGWIRSQFSDTVYMYRDGKDQEEEQMMEYRRRTVFTKDTITNGSVALKIRNIGISDGGQYQCYFEKNQVFQRATLKIKVEVTRTRISAAGLRICMALFIFFIIYKEINCQKKEREDTGNQHVCQRKCCQRETSDWGQNQVIRESLDKERESWDTIRESLNEVNYASEQEEQKDSGKDSKYWGRSEYLAKERELLTKIIDTLCKERESLTKERESLHMDRESLAKERQSLAIERESLDANRESLNKVNYESEQEEQKNSRKDSEYCGKSEKAKERESLAKEIDSMCTERESLTKEKESLDTDKESLERDILVKEREFLKRERWSLKKGIKFLGKKRHIFIPEEELLDNEKKFQVALQEEIERRKALYQADWRKAHIYADWRKEQFQAMRVTLDPDTAHPELILSEEWTRVIRRESPQHFPDTPKRFDSLPCVLGHEKITSGRHYWEVEVGNRGDWELGVCREDVKKKGEVTVSSESGFWAIKLYNDKYWALSYPPTCLSLRQSPHKVIIFIDYDFGDVSFYNMNDGSHIYSFTSQFFFGALCPYIRLWSCDQAPVTICPGP